MAKEEKDLENEEDVQEKGKSSNLKIIIIGVLVALLFGGGLVGGTFYLVSSMQSAEADSSKTVKSEDDEEGEKEEGEGEGEEEDAAEEEVPKGPAIYHSMDPKFVVSFRDQQVARFMQFSIEVMTRDKGVIELLDGHTPAIRSSLLMLFDNQNDATMSTREGKQQLLDDIVTDINETLKTMTNKDELEASVESAYFTSFVIQ